VTLPTAGRVAVALYERFEARDWDGSAALLAADVVYLAPQTRERVVGRDALITYMRSYPGDWHLAVARVIATDSEATVVVDATLDGEPVQSIAIFDVDASGPITAMTDYWPESYDRPASRAHLSDLY
jgi:ketosteroid isomerase-like protein